MVCPLNGRVKAGIYDDLEIDFSEINEKMDDNYE